MKINFRLTNQNGAVLIFGLWVLGFLSLIAATTAYGVRQKLVLIQRLEARSHIKNVSSSGVRMAVSFLLDSLQDAQYEYTGQAKEDRHNNPFFAQIMVGKDSAAEISYRHFETGREGEKFFGITDEESKINLNLASKAVLEKLMKAVLDVPEDQAQKLAEAVYDWRMMGESELQTFYSDDHYAGLKWPYPKKSSNFELFDELLLVKGITPKIYERLLPYVTIYGDGRVNINTAPKQVLMALGLEEALATKVIWARSGQDGIDMTEDDHVFSKTFDVTSEVKAYVNLKPEEIEQLDLLNFQGALTTNSFYYRIHSLARSRSSSETRTTDAVFNSLENRFVYWKER